MKLTKSKQFLADAIHASGKGWPDGANWAAMDKEWRGVEFRIGTYVGKPKAPNAGKAYWSPNDSIGVVSWIEGAKCAAPNWHQTILSREEYFSAYPEKQVEDDGYGEPVDAEFIPEPAAKPTIEQLAADYRNKLDFSNSKQQEADDANAAADAALGELVAAGKALGLVIGVDKLSPEPSLVIAKRHQLELGDVIWIGKSKYQSDEEKHPSGEYVVVKVGAIGLLHNERTFYPDFSARDWKFIRRP